MSPHAVFPNSGELENRLVDHLLSQGVLTQEQLNNLKQLASWRTEPLSDILLRETDLREVELTAHYAQLSDLPILESRDLRIEPGLLNLVPPRAVLRYRILPLRFDRQTLLLATDHLRDSEEIAELQVLLARPLDWILCTPTELTEAITHFYGVGLQSYLKGMAPSPTTSAPATTEENSGVPEFIDELIREAIRSKASDLHIEPREQHLCVRFRIDGVLHDMPLPKGIERFRKSIISSLKVMANLDIADRRLPQDGRIEKILDGEKFDIRISVLPTRHGESVALRLLNRSDTFLTLKELGLPETHRSDLDYLIRLPHGLLLFTGPTGSGKTTSQYAVLDEANDRHRKIITIEDPVEYQIEDITQLQIQASIGFTFAQGLRSILRHDPDVILVGEIRDNETAAISVSAALTGHLVLSTLHTNDSAGAAPRLIDMGIEPYLVASSLQGVISQRLLRCICTHCKQAIPLDDPSLSAPPPKLSSSSPPPQTWRGAGCPYCRFTGYQDRRALFEIMVIRDSLRSLIAERASSSVLFQKAVNEGLLPLMQVGWKRVLEGETTLEELLRITGDSHSETLGM